MRIDVDPYKLSAKPAPGKVTFWMKADDRAIKRRMEEGIKANKSYVIVPPFHEDRVRDYVFNGTCDMAFATAPSVVLGPGHSERSHAADEFITVPEIAEAIGNYAAIVRRYFASTA